MAIQMRRGNLVDFNPAKMLPGEWAVTIDSDTKKQIIYMCFKAGIVKRIMTVEDAESQIAGAASGASASLIQKYNSTLEEIKAALSDSKGYANNAKSYAIGGTGSRTGENTDNAKFYSDQAKSQKVAAETAKSSAASSAAAALSSQNASAASASRAETAAQQAAATNVGALAGRVDAIEKWEIGGENLLQGSGETVTNSEYLIAQYPITHAPKDGEPCVVTIWGELGEGKTDFRAYNSGGYVGFGGLVKIKDGVYQLAFRWGHINSYYSSNPADNSALFIYTVPNSISVASTIQKIKLEVGTKGTGWSPAPSDSSFVLSNLYRTRPKSANIPVFGDGAVRNFKSTAAMTEGRPEHDAHILHFDWDSMYGSTSQLALFAGGDPVMMLRNMTTGAWGAWKRFSSDDDLLGKVYPVGAIYLSTGATNPGALFGGTWEQVEAEYDYKTIKQTVPHTSGASMTALQAEIPAGYTFDHWVGAVSDGWVAAAYLQDMLTANTNIWIVDTGGNSRSYAGTLTVTGVVKKKIANRWKRTA